MDHVGQYIGRYFVEECIGRGAVATVYRVRHARLGGRFALKVLHASSDRMRARLMQEGRAQSTLRHPNLVTVTDLVHLDGDPGLVMEYVDGPTLAHWLKDHDPELPEAIELFKRIVRGVAYAHKHGWVHRDLKPANVLLFQTEDGWQPKVCDFGLVKVLTGEEDAGSISGQGMALGTPAYMAPEQIRNAAGVDHRADLFSLGCILFELVTGQRAFQAKGTLNVLHKVARAEYPPPSSVRPDIPSRLEILIAELLAVRPDQRIQSCDELLRRLGDPRLAGRPVSRQPRPQGPPTQTSVWLSVLAAVLGALVVALMALPLVAELEEASRRAEANNGLPALRLRPLIEEPEARAHTIEPDLLAEPPRKILPRAPEPEPEPAPEPELAPEPEPEPDEEPEVELPPGPRSAWKADPSAESEPSLTGEEALVEVVGDATTVWLVDGRVQYPVDVPIPPGTYNILAQFGGPAWFTAGKLKIKPHESIVLDCSAETGRCKH